MRRNAAKVSRRRMAILYDTFPDANLQNPRWQASLSFGDRPGMGYFFLPFLGATFLGAAFFGAALVFAACLAALTVGFAAGFLAGGAFSGFALAKTGGLAATADVFAVAAG